MAERKRVGLVGCGGWGKNILRDLLSLNCEVYVADTNAGARNHASVAGAVLTFPDARELPDCDGYFVSVPIPDLAPVCSSLLPRNRPVFAEKTLCLSLETADELEKLGGNKYIFAMHKWHYHPGIEALRGIAQSGRIGPLKEIFAIRHGWVIDFHGGDVFWTLAVHDLTIINHILGYIPEQISYAAVVRNQDGLPVSLTAVLGQGPVANLLVNARHANKISSVTIHGEKGAAVLQNAYDPFILVRNEKGEEKIGIKTDLPLFLELKEFVNYLHGGPRPRCGLNEAREVTRVLLALRLKAVTI